MKFPIIIKQSPFVLIIRIIQMELVIGVILFALSFLANYEDLYRSTPVYDFVRYDVFLVVISSIVQLIITLLVFFWWHGEEYRIKEKEIIYKTGLFFDKQYSVLLKKVRSVEYKRNLLEFVLGYGTIVINLSPGEKPLKIRSVESAEIYLNLIKEAVDLSLGNVREQVKPSLLDLILEGEHNRLEMKQTFRWDVRKKITSKELEKSAMKTISAFLNSEGGFLIIGISDNKTIYGLEDDYKTLPKKNRDGFENHFNQAIKTMIGAEFRQYINISFEALEEKDVCLVEIELSPRPVYLRSNSGDEEFFIRTGNSTTALKVSQVSSYIESRWP